MRIAVGLEYDGSVFRGWQSQAGQLTVQDCVEKSLSKVAAHPVSVQVAGRTDAGVHAAMQVVHFDTTAVRDSFAWVMGTNSHLHRPISLLWAKEVPDDFHARFSAWKRCYRYVIYPRRIRPSFLAKRVSWSWQELHAPAMHEAGQCLLGEQDFSSFRASGCQSNTAMRNIFSLKVQQQGNFIFLDIEANAFLYHMVRNIAGVLISVGSGKRPVSWVDQVLKAKDRRCATITAPAEGLYLTQVSYPEKYALPELSPSAMVW